MIIDKMEKLIELLNEYEKELNTGLHWRIDEEYGMLWRGISLTGVDQYLISKHYGFIKRLVENDKINSGTRNPLFITELVGEQEKQIPYSFYEEMLIRLALSDTPIEDLISYLK